MTPTQLAIKEEIYAALAALRSVPPRLLSVICSWGDTLTDEQVLELLKVWNTTGDLVSEPIPRKHQNAL